MKKASKQVRTQERDNTMADITLNNEAFEFTYSPKQREEVERIRNKYLPKQESKMEQLRKLDRQAEQPGQIASITAGIIGTLTFGVGLCFTLVWNTSIGMLIAGVMIGIVGMVIAGVAYPIYKKVTEKQRAKVADQIIALSNELSI